MKRDINQRFKYVDFFNLSTRDYTNEIIYKYAIFLVVWKSEEMRGGFMERLSLANQELFEDLILASDSHLNTVMGKVARGDFEAGDVTIKIYLSYEIEEMQVPRSTNDIEIKTYKKPVIKYAIKSNLKQSFSNESSVLTEGFMIDADEKSVKLRRVDDNQMSMLSDDYE